MYNSGNEYLPSRLGSKTWQAGRHIRLNPNEMYANWAWTSALTPEHVRAIGLIAAGEHSGGDNASYRRETDVRSSLSTPWLVIEERWSSFHSITHSHSPPLPVVFKWPVNPGSFLPRPRSWPPVWRSMWTNTHWSSFEYFIIFMTFTWIALPWEAAAYQRGWLEYLLLYLLAGSP